MLGVCYYPEHWPESRWAEDARLMAGLGISYVRIGEFCWSRLEPARDQLRWDWLDRALATLADAGLRVVLGTPTATPPKWLIDARPDILAHDDQGRPRRFGSRRHTCFSSPAWLEETRRIVELVASRYGPHPAVVGWQIDNEYGCHDTVRSYAPHCEPAFQAWLRRRYQHVDKLNQAWGTVFWSQEYADFDQVSLPHLTVTEANPAHRLDYARFSSDQVISYHQLQAEIVAAHAPGRFIAHNVMGFFDQFDHFDLADQLDVCGWDSYPVGFTACAMDLSENDKRRFARAGHPDAAAFQHDLYRSAVERRPASGPDADAPAARTPGRMWVMEQQPGPVNWAPYNPAPPDGMIRLWTWEALAHGAEAVCYFRWRQIPRAQEQLHAALLRPDAAPAPAWTQAAQVSRELAALDERVPAWRQLPAPPAPVALLFDYQAAWMLDIQPHSVGPGYLPLVRRCYTALRRLGLDVDFVRPGGSLDGYALVVAPTLPIIDDATWQALQRTDATTGATIIFGPRSGSRDHSFGIPAELPPGPLQQALPIVVGAIDSVRADMDGAVYWPTTGRAYPAGYWREHIDSELTPLAYFDDTARGAIYRAERWHYFAFHPDEALWIDYLEDTCRRLDIATVRLPENLRVRRRGPVTFACNSGDRAIPAPMPADAELILGADPIGPHDVAAWIEPLSHYQTLLIDLDHTLLDSDGSEAAAFADTLAAVGVTQAAQHLATYRHINGVLWREVERGTLSAPQVRVLRFEKLVAKLGLSADAQVMADTYARGLGANGDLYPGARDALEALAPAVSMALVTNGLSDIQRARVNRLEIGHYFDAIIISGEIGVAKPHPRFFDHAFEKMSQPDKATTLMVGDSLSADMRGGHHYGIATCWYNADGERNAGEQRDQITHEITHLDQLPGLVLSPDTAPR